MSSERPKLGPDIPKVITGWVTATGRVVYLAADRTWRDRLADAEIFTGPASAEVLAWAVQDQKRVADPYFMQVSAEGRIAGRETLRETLRSMGPSTNLKLGKQAGNN